MRFMRLGLVLRINRMEGWLGLRDWRCWLIKLLRMGHAREELRFEITIAGR